MIDISHRAQKIITNSLQNKLQTVNKKIRDKFKSFSGKINTNELDSLYNFRRSLLEKIAKPRSDLSLIINDQSNNIKKMIKEYLSQTLINQNTLNQLIYGICMMIANGLRYLSNVITDAIAKARSSRQYRGTEDHHIVARSDSRAGYSRKMINRHLIFTWHPVNIVTISKTLHKHLHTNAYFAAIDLCVASVIYMNNTWSDKRLHLIALLLTISVILKTASKFI